MRWQMKKFLFNIVAGICLIPSCLKAVHITIEKYTSNIWEDDKGKQTKLTYPQLKISYEINENIIKKDDGTSVGPSKSLPYTVSSVDTTQPPRFKIEQVFDIYGFTYCYSNDMGPELLDKTPHLYFCKIELQGIPEGFSSPQSFWETSFQGRIESLKIDLGLPAIKVDVKTGAKIHPPLSKANIYLHIFKKP